MASLTSDFPYSDSAEPHGDRTRAIIRAHPEIRELFGHNPYSLLFILGLVALQLLIAYGVRDRPVWQVALAAWLVGSLITHGLYVLMHETNHNLLFRRRWPNSVAGMIANLPSLVPSAVSFQRYHLKHHAYQGIHDLDGDLPSRWEARLVGNGTVRKVLWLLFFPVFLALRPAHLRGITHVCRWTAANWVVAIAFDVAVFVLLGPLAFLYLVFAMFFALGLHPVGARWISEHYMFSPPQETYSYYGALNVVAFNIGYHNEHHDFPAIPWNRIPRVRELAPESYDDLESHTSWTRLLLRFIFDRRMSLFSRMVRDDPGAKPLPPRRKTQPA